jgi:phage baseplate assembly protein W
MSRADRRTSSSIQVEYFSDFLNNFDLNPVTGQLARVTNEESIKQSLQNIVRTDLTERFYNPLAGSKAATSLFDLGGQIAIETIKSTVSAAISNYEKRAKLQKIDVTDINYGYQVDIFFECINLPGQTLFTSVILQRIR